MEATRIELQGVARPDIDLFKQELETLQGDAAQVRFRRHVAEATRYCLWDGQSADGRKHKKDNGNKEVFPFEGSSDHRVRLADTIIGENVRLGMRVLRGADAEVSPAEVSDAEFAGRTKQVLKHLQRVYKREVEDALRLYLNYREGDGPGLGVMGVFWEREMATELRTVEPEALMELALLASSGGGEPTAESLERAKDLLLNPNLEAEALALIVDAYGVDKVAARGALKKIRNGEAAELEVPYVHRDGPVLRPMRLWEDVFFPSNTTDIQKARCIFTRELLTEAELDARGAAREWPAEFLEKVKKHRGKSWLHWGSWEDYRYGRGPVEWRAGGVTDVLTDRYEIITAYAKAQDPKGKQKGLSGVYRTVFHGSVDEVAEHGPNGYWHGMYPFVVGTQERVSGCLMDSRGVGEIVVTDQLAKKRQVDLTIDASELTALPSIKLWTRRKDARLQLGPLKQHQMDRHDKWEWADGPKLDPRSQVILDRVEKDVDMYFGRMTEVVKPDYALMVQQDRADRILSEGESMWTQVLMLAQQYLPQAEAERIAPGWKQPLNAGGPEGVRKRYDIYLSFDVKSADSEFVEKKLKAFNEFLVPLDKYGLLDGTEMLRDAAKLIDPVMADKYVKSAQSASESEIEETMQTLSFILNGIQPSMPERGINHELRYRTLSNAVLTNPQIQKELSIKPLSMQLLTDYMKFLQQMMVQENNKVTGRKGTSLSLGGTGAAPVAGSFVPPVSGV